MTVANTTVKVTYNGDGINVTFAIPFAFIPGEADTVTLVTLIDAAGVETVQNLGADYTLDPAGDNPVNVLMIVAPSGTETLRVERQTVKTQDLDLNDGGSFPGEEVEKQLDRTIHHVQELCQDIIDIQTPAVPASVASSLVPDWVTATAYIVDQTVLHDNGTGQKWFRATVAHTSGVFDTDFGLGRWEFIEVNGEQGIQGVQGPIGNPGIQGIQGIQGIAGTNGINGIITALASQAEAEAGVENTKGMTPLRTAQALAAQIGADPTFVALEARVSALEVITQDHENRLISLETNVLPGTGRWSGSQILRNTTGPTLIEGGFTGIPGEGRGAQLERNSSGTEFAEVQLMIRRKTDTEFRFATFDLIMQFNSDNDTWFIGRDGTVQLDVTLDLDGVILTVATTPDGGGGFIGKVSYTTDTMAGANHDTQSEIKWLGQEIPKNV